MSWSHALYSVDQRLAYALLRAQVSTVGARMAAKKFEAEGYPIYPANVSVSCGIE